MKNKIISFFLFTFVLFFQLHSAQAATEVPDPLKPWVSWALKGKEESLCPFLHQKQESRFCAWPSILFLEMNEKGGTFHQRWKIEVKSWVPLPGSEKEWPQEVLLNQKPTPVISKENHPFLLLEKGEHEVTGKWNWNNLPNSLQIANEIGVLQLTVNGKPVLFPNRTAEGELWISSPTTTSTTQEDHLETHIYRLLEDEIPFKITTRIVLQVAGKNRELKLPSVLINGFTPLSLNSPIPARLEKNGDILVQLRPGNWTVEIESYHSAPVKELALSPVKTENGEKNWPEEEVWVFQSHPEIRQVTLEGIAPIDPQQTELPEEWKQLPAYRLQPENRLMLNEKQRGNAYSLPDQLSLKREIWLDSNGRGYSFRDHINGTLNKSSRIEMNPPFQLGRVSIENQDQLITTLDGKKSGVETGTGTIDLTGESRLTRESNFLPIGWNHDFDSLSATLHLPPGWRIFHISGVDRLTETWLLRWSLMELFLVLILSLGIAKLWGKKWGVIAFFTFILLFPEEEAPKWIWIFILSIEAIVRLAKGKLLTFFKTIRVLSFVVLLLVALPFSVHQLRSALYPALENEQTSSVDDFLTGEKGTFSPKGRMRGGSQNNPPNIENERSAEPLMKKEGDNIPPPPSSPRQYNIAKSKIMVQEQQQDTSRSNLQKYLPDAKVQTGFGIPEWSWREVSLNWNGNVQKDHPVSLFLISPSLQFALTAVRILLLALLVLHSLRLTFSHFQIFKKADVSKIVVLFIFSILSFSQIAHAQTFPSNEMLNELSNRLLEPPLCSPECATISNLRIEANRNSLKLQLDIHSQANTAIPIPYHPEEWAITSFSSSPPAAIGIRKTDEQQLFLQIPPGNYSVNLEGTLSDRETISIPLPLKPYHLSSKLDGWKLEGIDSEEGISDTLQLIRTGTETTTESTPTTDQIPSFVKVNRSISIGLGWEMTTSIERLSPSDKPIVLDIPLLEGESVTSSNVKVENKQVRITLPAYTDSIEWNSILEKKETLSLQAGETKNWVENWEISSSPIWHLTFEGISPIQVNSSERGKLTWSPYPGEKVQIKINRPEGIKGSNLTIDKSSIEWTPTNRSLEGKLSMDIRSSLGGEHLIKLPVGAELQKVEVDGVIQTIQQREEKVLLPIHPGKQSFTLEWKLPLSFRNFFKTPSVDLGVESVNHQIEVKMPENRWTLWIKGPVVGPAVLFWSFLGVLLLVAVLLGRSSFTPLKTWQWILLGIGLSQTPAFGGMIIAGWFLIFEWKNRNALGRKWKFNFLQVGLILWTLIMIIVLFGSIEQGLLGSPDMQISGNQSSPLLLKWFQDRAGLSLPSVTIVSFPLYCYRIGMLLWALWIAWSLLRWFKWGWGVFSKDGVWRK